MKKLFVKTRILLLTLMASLITASSAFATATIVIQNNDPPGVGFNDPTPVAPIGGNSGTTLGEQRLNAVQFAANIWGATLSSGPPITVQATWESLPCAATAGTLGSAAALDMRRDFGGAPFSATWYSVALANSLSDSDLNSGTAEIRARFNVNVGTPGCLQTSHWYYGLDTTPASGRVNLVTLSLHELSHGLGFQTFTDEETGVQAGGFASIYDRFLFDVTANKTWVEMTNAERAASARNTPYLQWNGPQVISDAATVLRDGTWSLGRVIMWAPPTFQPGSSVSHWHTLAAPNQLMEPNIASDLGHTVTPQRDLTFSLMKDIGWPGTAPPGPPPPSNDNFVNAQIISGCSGSVTGTNVGATREVGEPNHSLNSTGGIRSVWYRWQAPSSGSVDITTAGSNFDTLLGVYTGAAVGSLIPIARNDNDFIPPGTVTSSVFFTANVGTIYWIVVDGHNNSGSAGDVGSITLNWRAPNCFPPNNVSFSSAAFSVSEGVDANGIGFEGTGFRTITVQRTGDLSAAGTVEYRTSNGSAEARKDYAQSAGTLRFAPNEGSKTFIVFVNDDVFQESPETVNLTLSNPVHMTLGSTPTAVLTIDSNDATTGPNPVDPNSFNTGFFVRQHYIDFFSREPDLAGLNFWKNQIDECTNEPCREVRRINVSAAFYLSIEFQQTGYLVYRTFATAFSPIRAGAVPLTLTEFLPDVQHIGRGVIIGQPGAEALLEANKQAYFNEFAARPQFVALYGTEPRNGFVDRLNLNAGGVLSPAERDALVNGTQTRAQVLRAVAEDSDLVNAHFNRAFVLMQYFGYLRRNPNDPPEPTLGFQGYLFWLNKLNQFNGNFVNAEMVKAFITSAEYRQRFGP